MATLPRPSRRVGRFVQCAALTCALSLSAAACSKSDPKNSPSSSQGSSSAVTSAKAATAALNAGLKAHAAGNLTEAAADYNKVLSFDKTNKFALYNLALIDAANGNYGLAEGKYRAALKTDAKYEPALFNLAILRTGADPKEAISLYQRAVAAKKTDAAAWLNLGLLLRANGKELAGDKAVLKAIALNPQLKDPAKSGKGSGAQSPLPTSTP